MQPLEKSLGLVETKDFAEMVQKAFIPQGVDIPKPDSVFTYNGIDLFTKKSISLITAKPKAGKTTATAWMVAQMINLGVKVLWLDTEQGEYYSSRTQFWILSIAKLERSENLIYYDLKIHPPEERTEMIEYLLENGTYDFIVIDGIRDLVYDINSPDEATLTATNLMKWAEVQNIHILTILHQNKGNENARGHLGSELLAKGETCIKLAVNDAKQIVIEPEYTRGPAFETFALGRDENGIPYLIDDWEQSVKSDKKDKIFLPNQIDDITHFEILRKVLPADPKKKLSEFLQSLKNELSAVYSYSIPDSKINAFKQYYLDKGMVITNGKTPHTKYIFNG